MARTGKIARLPRAIRDALNTRLDDGESARSLVDWLNSLEEVKTLVAADFKGVPVTDGNLSEWKQGGFRDWQRWNQTRERLGHVIEFSDDLAESEDGATVANRLARVLAADLATEIRQLLDQTAAPKERWQFLCDALRQLNALRRGEYAVIRAGIEKERWAAECRARKEEAEEKHRTRARERAVRPIWDAMHRSSLVSIFGGGEKGEKMLDDLIRAERMYEDSDIPPDPTSPGAQPQKSD